jgi:DNA-binding CsgD family transcriptional regulator
VVDSSDQKGTTDLFGRIHAESEQFGYTSAQDLFRTLSASLKPSERAVLECLADGLSTTEIVKRTRLSSPTVAKYRRKIAELARKYGFSSGVVSTVLSPPCSKQRPILPRP